MPVQLDETVKLSKSKGPMTIQKRGSVFTVILRPHNTNFHTRTLELRDKVRIRIGRQTSQKTSPTAYNGYFDSKVLSRQHAEIWCDKSRVYVKDVKSSNGTFVNGSRLSNECEESEPMELKSQDVIEFGIDIIGDNGVIMYHKVSCNVHIFPVPLSQVDDGIIKELSNHSQVQIFADPHSLTRKSSTSSINTLSSVSTEMNGSPMANGVHGKKTKKLESVLAKLQAEMEKSRQMENELKSIKETVTDLDKVFSEEKMKMNEELSVKLNQAELKIKSFDEKWRHQNQAILTAKSELTRLERQIDGQKKYKLENERMAKDLLQEQRKVKALEEEILQLKQKRQERPKSQFWDAIQIKSVQVVFAVLVGVISTLFYVLYN